MDTFKFAGVSKHNGKMKFRATNRAGYDEILIKEGKTNVDIRTLPKAMDKIAAKGYLITLPEFQTPEILDVLGAGDLATQVRTSKGPKVAKVAKVAKDTKVKAPKEQKGAVVASVKTAEEIEAIRQKNLETMREVGAKRKILDEREREQERARQELAAQELEEADVDIRDVLPKFLHKEMGIA